MIRNSLEMINKLKDFNALCKTMMISLYVTNLSINISTENCVTYIENPLKISKISKNIFKKIMLTLHICFSQTLFKFNNQFYAQNVGLPQESLVVDKDVCYEENIGTIDINLSKYKRMAREVTANNLNPTVNAHNTKYKLCTQIVSRSYHVIASHNMCFQIYHC